jgi:CRISPR-associated protein Cas2
VLILVCYDVSHEEAGARRLRRIAALCKDYGVRVQYSVFECRIEPRDWVVLKARLLAEYEPALDSLRFYRISSDDAQRTEHYGVRPPLDPSGPLVV